MFSKRVVEKGHCTQDYVACIVMIQNEPHNEERIKHITYIPGKKQQVKIVYVDTLNFSSYYRLVHLQIFQ